MTTYTLKDKERYAALVKAFPNFEEIFNRCCERQFSDCADYVQVGGDSWSMLILKKNIEVKEDLKPYTWHKAEDFDGNPHNYILIERATWGRTQLCSEADLIHSLYGDTAKFMYIER